MPDFRDAMNVAETARLIQMSRSRFNQLLGSVFPQPQRDERGRPFFDRQQQMRIVEIRRTNKGMDGRPILFRATGSRTSSPKRPRTKSPAISNHDYTQLLSAVRSLGLERATHKDIEHCLSTLFPDGRLPADQGTLIRQVFLSIKSRFSANNEQR